MRRSVSAATPIYYVPGTPYVSTYLGNGTPDALHLQRRRRDPGRARCSALRRAGPEHLRAERQRRRCSEDQGRRLHRDVCRRHLPDGPGGGCQGSTVFGSATAATYGQNVHQGVSVKPAAIRGKDIQVFVGGTLQSPTRWTDVQSVGVEWRSSLEDDFEFGNVHAVSREATDVPTVSGTIELKPVDSGDPVHQAAPDLWRQLGFAGHRSELLGGPADRGPSSEPRLGRHLGRCGRHRAQDALHPGRAHHAAGLRGSRRPEATRPACRSSPTRASCTCSEAVASRSTSTFSWGQAFGPGPFCIST